MNLHDTLHQLHEVFEDKDKHGVILKLYLENFKRLNNIFGYEYCEKLLEQIVSYLGDASDCHVCRYVGVEFILILEQYTKEDAERLADTITERFNSPWIIGGTDCMCSVEIGMCAYPGNADDESDLIKCLDLALAKAGELGPNQFFMYDSTLREESLRRQTIARRLPIALQNGEIEVRFRPTYNIEEKRFSRAEFYMRIFIKGLGMIGAGDFLPVAEDSGQVRTLEYFALEQVGKCIKDLMEADIEFDSIALPISSILFLQEDFLLKVEELMEKYQIPPGKLAIEVQENIFITAYLNVNVVMQELADMGVELILNNFGTGYSGITSILDLPIDTVKLDRMFIWQLETNPAAAHIIRGLVQIANHLELNIIAEGVETENQLELLSTFSCPLQQGFYYAPTVTQDLLKQVLGRPLLQVQGLLLEEKERLKR